MNSQNLDQEIKNAQDEFIKDLRKLEQHEHDLALQEAYEKEKKMYNICGYIYLISSVLIVLGWYAHYNIKT